MRKSTRRLLKDEILDTTVSFSNVKRDFNDLHKTLGGLKKFVGGAYGKLVGKIRGIQAEYEALHSYVDGRFKEIDNNGVATAINKLNAEVFKNEKEGQVLFNPYSFLRGVASESQQEPTLAGKVEAILEYLKLDVNVAPEQVKKAKPVAKKIATKKGRR